MAKKGSTFTRRMIVANVGLVLAVSSLFGVGFAAWQEVGSSYVNISDITITVDDASDLIEHQETSVLKFTNNGGDMYYYTEVNGGFTLSETGTLTFGLSFRGDKYDSTSCTIKARFSRETGTMSGMYNSITSSDANCTVSNNAVSDTDNALYFDLNFTNEIFSQYSFYLSFEFNQSLIGASDDINLLLEFGVEQE